MIEFSYVESRLLISTHPSEDYVQAEKQVALLGAISAFKRIWWKRTSLPDPSFAETQTVRRHGKMSNQYIVCFEKALNNGKRNVQTDIAPNICVLRISP